MEHDNDVARSIGRLEGKVDMLIDLHTSTMKRVAALEKRVWWAAGAVGVVILFVRTGITNLIGH